MGVNKMDKFEEMNMQFMNSRKLLDYDSHDYVVSELLNNRRLDLSGYVSEWSNKQKSEFVEDVFLGTFLFLNLFEYSGKITPKTQLDFEMLNSLVEFYKDKLVLSDMEILTSLNGLKSSELTPYISRKLSVYSVRTVNYSKIPESKLIGR